jgi:hypothetical protein
VNFNRPAGCFDRKRITFGPSTERHPRACATTPLRVIQGVEQNRKHPLAAITWKRIGVGIVTSALPSSPYGGGNLFPTNTYNSTSYAVDVVFKPQLVA